MVSKDGTSERTPAQEVALLTEAMPALEKAFKDAVVGIEKARTDPKADFMGLAKVALAAEAAVGKAKAKVGSFQYKIDNASRIAKQADVTKLAEVVQGAVKGVVSQSKGAMKGLEVTGFTINVTTSDNGELEVGVKASGPGVVTAHKSGGGGGGGGGGRGRSTLGNGQSWADIATEHGLDPKGASAHKVVKTRLPEVHDAIPHDCTI